jgi:DNA-binding NarL/FixJ family response regulator
MADLENHSDSTDALRVAVVEDDAMLSSLLARAIQRESDMAWTGAAATIDEALALFVAQRPELVLLDLRLGREPHAADGWQLFEQWPQSVPSPRWIVVTGQPEAAHLRRALDVGVAGYVTKSEPFEVLLAALREVREGRQYYSVGALKLLMDQPAASPGLAQLTPRERDVLRLAGEGLSVRQAAARLEISEETVKTHRKSLMRKLDLHDTVAVTRFAIGAGLAV